MAKATTSSTVQIVELDPRELIANPALNSRRVPPARKNILRMASQFADPNVGQLEPIEVRNNPDGSKQVTFGFSRHAAALALVNGDGIEAQPGFKIQAIEADREDADAYMMSVIENKQRSETNAIDDAYAAVTLKETYGKTDKEIGDILGVSQPWVGLLRSVTTTIKPIQDLVAVGHILPREAGEISKLSKDQQKEVAETVKTQVQAEGGRISPLDLPAPEEEAAADEGDDAEAPASGKGGKRKGKKGAKKTAKKAAKQRSKPVAKAVRKALKKAKGGAAVSGEAKPPSRNAMIIFWQDVVDTDTNENRIAFAKTQIRYINGKVGETALLNALKAL